MRDAADSLGGTIDVYVVHPVGGYLPREAEFVLPGRTARPRARRTKDGRPRPHFRTSFFDDADRRADLHHVIERLNVRVVHADAAFGRGLADGVGVVGAVYADMRAGDAHPPGAVRPAGVWRFVDNDKVPDGGGRQQLAHRNRVGFDELALLEKLKPPRLDMDHDLIRVHTIIPFLISYSARVTVAYRYG